MIIDCHVHTVYSKHPVFGRDATTTPKEAVKYAAKKGLGGIAITDHSTVKGALSVIGYARKKGVLVIPGIEVKTTHGDMIALGVKEPVPDGLGPEETAEKIKSVGGVSVAPHPFASYVLKPSLGEKSVFADAVEIFNAAQSEKTNGKAKALAEKLSKPVTAGSDAHFPEFIGLAGIRCESSDTDGVLEEILSKKVIVFGTQYPRFSNIINLMRKVKLKYVR
ncbi:MAG: PHP domain-containing protein [Candidatus Micrarchaeota archaeon]|nr:PHP domain-containing protein [Candidatus Micrarchaeota archaeon]